MILQQPNTGAKSRFGNASASDVATPSQGNSVPVTVLLPVGAPSWITSELIADTIETWQPYYTRNLTVNDALEILPNVGNLADALEDSA